MEQKYVIKTIIGEEYSKWDDKIIVFDTEYEAKEYFNTFIHLFSHDSFGIMPIEIDGLYINYKDMKQTDLFKSEFEKYFVRKYELLEDDNISCKSGILYRIKALRDFGKIKAGDLGGYIEKEENLSHWGDCWISSKVKIYDDAKVYDNAIISVGNLYANAEVYDCVNVSGRLDAGENSKICGNTNIPYGSDLDTHNSEIYGDILFLGNNNIAYCEISDKVTLCDCTILGGYNKPEPIKAKICGTIFLNNLYIDDAAKINSDYDYGIIRGFGSSTDIEFFKTLDDTIKVLVDMHPSITFDEFKKDLSLEENPELEHLFKFVESTILGGK